ncbi:MAG TPA: response regulator [Vineibacter sp.]|nr:response regulator [Vineibacter sp.]
MANLSDRLLTTLPYLRRYARALTGSQATGDRWVRQCVEALVRQPGANHAGRGSKADMFALFHSLHQIDGSAARGESGGDSAAGGNAPTRLTARMRDISATPRRMLLLTALEGFTVEEAARILGIDATTAAQELAAARSTLQQVASVRVLVIEDEAVIALDVAKVVRNAGHLVVGIAATEKAAVELAEKHAPDLVLADIQLQGGDSGMAAVRAILASTRVPIIFVTGYPERLLTGRGIEPAFVIAKPFDADLLKTAMAQALNIAAA